MKVLCIVGPTASGKTALSLRAALALDGEILSCDSVQIYKGFDIGSAKPTPAELALAPHHMIDVALPHEAWSAGRYARMARSVIQEVAGRGKLPIVCGGTGLYLRALLGGLDDIPPVPRGCYGDDAYQTLCRVDPVSARKLSPGDRKRIERALDVYHATGRPLSDYHQGGTTPDYTPVIMGITAPDRRGAIARRAEDMFRGGLVAETARLLESGVSEDCAPMQAIGYKQARAVLSGAMTPDQALENTILRTCQYAKRQMTWFRNQIQANWLCFPDSFGANSIELEKFYENAIKTMEIHFSM